MSTSSSEISTQPPKKLFESDSEGSEDEQKEDGSEYEPSGSEDNDENDIGDGTDGAGTDNEVTDSRDQSDNVPETETEEEEEEPEPDISEEEMMAAIRMLRESLGGLKTDLVKFTDATVAGMVGDHYSRMDKFISGEEEYEDDDEDLSQVMNRMAARQANFTLGTAVGGYSPQVPTSSGILASGGSSNVSAMSTPTYSSQDDQDYPFVPPSQPSSSMSPFKTPGTPKKGNGTPMKEEVTTPKKEIFSPKKEVVTPKKEKSTPKKAASTPKKTPKKSPMKKPAAEQGHELIQVEDIKVEIKDEPDDSVMEIVLNDGTVCTKKMDNVCNCPIDHGTPTRSTRSAAKKSR